MLCTQTKSTFLWQCLQSGLELNHSTDNNKPLASYIIQLLHAMTGSMALCTSEGENGTRGEAEGAICYRGCKKTMDPSHSVQQLFRYTLVTLLFLFSKFCCHLQTLLRRSNAQFNHGLISRRTVQIRNNSSPVPSNPRVFRTALEIDQRWERSR